VNGSRKALDWLGRHGWAVGATIAVIGMAAWATIVRFRFLDSSPLPVGIDGYWYPIQVRSLLERGHLYFPSAPLVLWLMAPATLLTDAFTGPKLVAALGTGALALPAYLLGKRLSGDRAAGLAAAALAATSAQSFYLSTEFVKQGIGTTFALGFLAALAWTLDRPSRGRLAASAALLAACLLSHKVALALAVVGGTPAALAYAWTRVAPEKRTRVLILAGAALAVAAIAIVVAGAIAPKRFIGPKDLVDLGEMFRLDPDFTFAVLHPPGNRPPLVLRHEVVIAGALALAIVVASPILRELFPDAPRIPPIAWGMIALALFVASPLIDTRDEQAMGMRLRLLSHATMGPLAALLLRTVIVAIPKAARVAVTASALVFALALVSLAPTRSNEGVIRTHPALDQAMRATDGVMPAGGHFITQERHVLYMATWYSRVPGRLKYPGTPDPRTTYRLFPGALIGPELRNALDELRASPRAGVVPPRDLHPFTPNGAVLVTEPTWLELLARLPPAAREHYLRWEIR
jgi:hypothetical protein